MNATTEFIIAQLRKASQNHAIVTAQHIADAYCRSTNSVIAAIKAGKLAAQFQGGCYLIARSEAERYIRSNEVIPDEGTIK